MASNNKKKPTPPAGAHEEVAALEKEFSGLTDKLLKTLQQHLDKARKAEATAAANVGKAEKALAAARKKADTRNASAAVHKAALSAEKKLQEIQAVLDKARENSEALAIELKAAEETHKAILDADRQHPLPTVPQPTTEAQEEAAKKLAAQHAEEAKKAAELAAKKREAEEKAAAAAAAKTMPPEPPPPPPPPPRRRNRTLPPTVSQPKTKEDLLTSLFDPFD